MDVGVVQDDEAVARGKVAQDDAMAFLICRQCNDAEIHQVAPLRLAWRAVSVEAFDNSFPMRVDIQVGSGRNFGAASSVSKCSSEIIADCFPVGRQAETLAQRVDKTIVEFSVVWPPRVSVAHRVSRPVNENSTRPFGRACSEFPRELGEVWHGTSSSRNRVKSLLGSGFPRHTTTATSVEQAANVCRACVARSAAVVAPSWRTRSADVSIRRASSMA